MNRIDRLTAILIHLQSRRIVKAAEIAARFEISLRVKTGAHSDRPIFQGGLRCCAGPHEALSAT